MYIIIILFIPFIFLSILTYFQIFLFHDTLFSFENFKYFYDNLTTHNHIPTWLENNYGGSRLSQIYDLPIALSALFIIFGYYLKIDAYYIFLVYLSFIYSVYNFGLIKLINILDLKNKLFISLLISLISILGINIFNEYIFTLFSYILFPYYIYYFLKFKKNQKIQEFFKIITLYLVKFCIFFHYINIVEFYFLIFCIIFIILKSSNIKDLCNKFFLIKNLKYFFFHSILVFIIFINYNNNKSYKIDHYQRLSDGSLPFDKFSTSPDGLINASYKIHSFFSNYLFGESNLIILNIGLFFLIYAITKLEIRKLFVIKSAIIISFLFIFISFIDLYEKNLRNYIYVILYQMPLIKYQFHIFYWHLFAKTFILIIIAHGINSFLLDIEINNKKHLASSTKIYLILIILYFIFYFFFKNHLFDKYAKISLLLSVIPIIVFNIIIFKVKDVIFFKVSYFKILIILIIFPVVLFNFSNYSFSNSFSFIKNEKKEENFVENYKNSYFINSNLKKFSFDCKKEDEIYRLIPSTKIKNFIIRGSTDYNANIFNQNIYGCDKIFALGHVENLKIFKEFPKNFIYDQAKNITRYNNQFFSFSLDKTETKIRTNLSFSKNWIIYSDNDKKIEYLNENNFLVIFPKDNSTIFLKYKNKKETYYIMLKLILGLVINFYFFISLFQKIKQLRIEDKI